MPYRERRGGNEFLVVNVDPKRKRTEAWYDLLGWIGLGCIILGAALQAIGALLATNQSWVMNTTPEFWTALFTCGLFAVALFALFVAMGQLNTVKTERTVSLIKEISSEEMEAILGFFDFAANKDVSRRAFSSLFARLIKHRPQSISDKLVADIGSASADAEKLITDEIDDSVTLPTGVIDDERREKELRRRIVLATNFFERLWALLTPAEN